MKEIPLEEILRQKKYELHEKLERILLSVEFSGGYDSSLERDAIDLKEAIEFLTEHGKELEFFELNENCKTEYDTWQGFCTYAPIDEIYLWSSFVKPKDSYFYGKFFDYIYQVGEKFYLHWERNIYFRPQERKIPRKRIWATIDAQGKLVYTEITGKEVNRDGNLALPFEEVPPQIEMPQIER